MFRLLFTILFSATLVYAQPQQTWVDSIYAQMTLDQKIGQLFMVMAYPDGNASKRMVTSKQILAQHIGGVLFSKGTSKQQVRDNAYLSKSNFGSLAYWRRCGVGHGHAPNMMYLLIPTP